MSKYCEQNWSDLAWYIKDVDKYPLLSKEEQNMYLEKLSEAKANGDEVTVKAVAEKLFLHNRKLALKAVKGFRQMGNPAVSLEDMVQEASQALLDAINGFNCQRSGSLSTYAMLLMTQRLARLREMIGLRPPSSVRGAMKVLAAQSELRAKYGREPELEEIAKETGFSVKVIKQRLAENSFKMVSLQAPVDEKADSKQTYEEAIDADVEHSTELHLDFSDSLCELMRNALSVTECRVLYLRYGLSGEDKMTLEEVGKRLDMSLENVRKLETKALATLRKHLIHELAA